MSRIVHLALKVDDLEQTTAFYQNVFGFQEVETARTRDHVSRHLTDGTLDFTLINMTRERSRRSRRLRARGRAFTISPSKSKTCKRWNSRSRPMAVRSSAIRA